MSDSYRAVPERSDDDAESASESSPAVTPYPDLGDTEPPAQADRDESAGATDARPTVAGEFAGDDRGGAAEGDSAELDSDRVDADTGSDPMPDIAGAEPRPPAS